MFQRHNPPQSSPLAPEDAEDQYEESADVVETVVGPSVHVEGDFSSSGNIIIRGIVSGNVKTSQQIHVEAGAKIHADVRAGNAIISGEIRGNVHVDHQLELTSTAQVAGDLQCEVLVIEAGALLHGKVTMNGIEIEPKKKAATRARRTAQTGNEE